MGLDIVAFSRGRFLGPRGGDDYDEHEDHVLVYGIEPFLDRLDGQPQGWYAVDGDWLRFQAGSYGGYNEWRSQLSRAALGVEPREVWEGLEDFAGRPFAELINFADNEGAIGPVTSAKLLADFEADPKLPDRVSDDPFDWFESKYVSWREAFALAADGGFVVFR